MIKTQVVNVSSESSQESNVEERSSLLKDSDPIAENLNEIKPLQFENLGSEYEKLQNQVEQVEEVKEDERAELKKTITNVMSYFEDPA